MGRHTVYNTVDIFILASQYLSHSSEKRCLEKLEVDGKAMAELILEIVINVRNCINLDQNKDYCVCESMSLESHEIRII